MTINQLQLFIVFMANGILIGLFFDAFRILRKSFKHQDILIYFQDILFWIITGVILIYSTFIFNDGEFRTYLFLGVFLGFFIYLFTISKWIIKINVSIILSLKKIIGKILKILLIPIKYLIMTIRKIFLKPITFFVINLKRKTTKKEGI